MIAALILIVACSNPPLFDLSGPDCSPENQDIACQCSECMTWPKVDDVDWYDIRRIDQDGTVHTVIGSSKIHQAYIDQDGTEMPKIVETKYCVAMDASVPLEGRRYLYSIRSCAAKWTPNCSEWSSFSVSYIGAPYRCYDQEQGGQVPCPYIP